MNRWVLAKVIRGKYRKYAFRISAVTHIIGILVIALLLFFKTEVRELEDEIQVDIIREPHVLITDPPQPPPKLTPKAETPKPEMPVPPKAIPVRKKMTLQKEVNVVEHKQSTQIAEKPASASTTVAIQQPSVKRLDVDAATFSPTPDLATAADLPTSPDTLLSPIGTPVARTEQGHTTRRGDTGARSPKKGAGEGSRITKGTKGTGAVAGTKDIGGTDTGTGGSGDEGATFSSMIAQLTDDIIASSGSRPIDVIFVVDASGSMQDNINAVAAHLSQMTDAYKASEIDYQLGLTHFNMALNSNQNNIHVFQLTQNLSVYKQALYAIIPTGDENALDAIHQTLIQMQFRTNTIKHLILVTDEAFTSLQGHTVDSIIQLCQTNELIVHVLGENMLEHKKLAAKTSGSWHAVPLNTRQPNNIAPSQSAGTQNIGDFILTDATNIPVDIFLFIDSSKSMENRVVYLTEQIDLWIRNWDHALIDYRIGVVRFRAQQGLCIVNVFKPPQTQAQLHKILQLPYQADENLPQAVIEGAQRIQRRSNAKTHFILITDEPTNTKQPTTGTIEYLKGLSVIVSVIGATDNFQKSVALQTGGVFFTIPNPHPQNIQNE